MKLFDFLVMICFGIIPILKKMIISIDDLIELKKIAGRKWDEIDIEALKKIKEIKNG